MAKTRSPFEVPLTPDQRKMLAVYLTWELQNALDARSAQEVEVDYWHLIYEQGRTRAGRDVPWADAADLTSYLGTEKVDALHARIMRTVFGAEPIWNVEGWGDAAPRAPFVEEFHQWKAQEERLESAMDRFVLQALIEPRGLVEVAEGTETRVIRKTINAKLQTDPLTGGVALDEKFNPQPELGPDGKYVEAADGDPQARMVVDSTEPVRVGPIYRVIPYRDSVITPGHARDKQEIWGYWKRFYRRYSEVKRSAEGGIYDQEAVGRMGNTQERETDPALQRAHQAVAASSDPSTADKELWEGLVLLDLNSLFAFRNVGELSQKEYPGPRWFLVTLHPRTHQILRFQHDDLERSRFVPLMLFPRVDRATEGFSFIGHKLITAIEEHTAWRNMAADRGHVANNAPIKRLRGALWDPSEQPFGPGQVIDVANMQELEPFAMPDVNASVFQHIAMLENISERLAGINDIAGGQVSKEQKTLGEIQMATEQSFVRMDLIVRRFQDAFEEIAQIRHEIWKRVLADQEGGMAMPQSMLMNLEGRGTSIDAYLPGGKITAGLLAGAFRFKPHGSTETANPQQLRQDWAQAIQALPPMLQLFPMLGPMLQTPQAARAFFRQWLHVFRVPNASAFIGSPAQDLATQGAMPGMMPPMPLPLPPGPVGIPGVGPLAQAPVAPPVMPLMPPPMGVQ